MTLDLQILWGPVQHFNSSVVPVDVAFPGDSRVVRRTRIRLPRFRSRGGRGAGGERGRAAVPTRLRDRAHPAESVRTIHPHRSPTSGGTGGGDGLRHERAPNPPADEPRARGVGVERGDLGRVS